MEGVESGIEALSIESKGPTAHTLFLSTAAAMTAATHIVCGGDIYTGMVSTTDMATSEKGPLPSTNAALPSPLMPQITPKPSTVALPAQVPLIRSSYPCSGESELPAS